MRRKGTARELDRRCRRAMALVEQDYGIRETAALGEAAPSSISDWIARYQAHGVRVLEAKPNFGRPARLSARQQASLHGCCNKARNMPIPPSCGTLARIAELIARHFGVHYDPSGA